MAIETDGIGSLEKERRRMCLSFSIQNMATIDKFCKYLINDNYKCGSKLYENFITFYLLF